MSITTVHRFIFLICSTVCVAKIDLAFVIDSSGSIEASGRGNFKRCLDFVKRLVASFKISRKYTRVGAVVYSSRARKVFGFNRYNNKRLLMKAIDRIPYFRRGTKTGYALSYAQRYLFRGRSRRRKPVLIVMTDGRSSDRVRGRALALHRSGIETFAVGIGKNYDIRQLIQIASTRRNVYVARFRTLPNIVRVIKSKACKGMLLLVANPKVHNRGRGGDVYKPSSGSKDVWGGEELIWALFCLRESYSALWDFCSPNPLLQFKNGQSNV